MTGKFENPETNTGGFDNIPVRNAKRWLGRLKGNLEIEGEIS